MSHAVEQLPEDMLRELCEGQIKERKAIEALARAVLAKPPIEIKNEVHPAQPGPAPVVNMKPVRKWHHKWTKYDENGKCIGTIECESTAIE